ncbi:DUF6357 family protein [Micromonospora matsumotoense]|uniref:DUF6357 family protein n=1 Tax=Micromonospora matsumotoense TaxID=121616 RepID=UPI0024807CEF|nr:DUF6357 family protein [Micromonospora matsumotoense]
MSSATGRHGRRCATSRSFRTSCRTRTRFDPSCPQPAHGRPDAVACRPGTTPGAGAYAVGRNCRRHGDGGINKDRHGYRTLVSAFVRGGCAALEQHGPWTSDVAEFERARRRRDDR